MSIYLPTYLSIHPIIQIVKIYKHHLGKSQFVTKCTFSAFSEFLTRGRNFSHVLVSVVYFKEEGWIFPCLLLTDELPMKETYIQAKLDFHINVLISLTFRLLDFKIHTYFLNWGKSPSWCYPSTNSVHLFRTTMYL